MKQRITFTMLILWILSSVIPLGTAFASPITSQQAQQNVMDFLKKKGKTVAKSALHDISSKGTTSKNYFVFNVGNNEGFVIASADDQVPAILGYSSRGTVLIEAMPANLKAWLDSYDKQISYIQEQGIKGSTPITSTHAAISPLMTTTWDQDDPYNQSCPDFFTYGKSVTGCVATAMAQIMYYHRNRSVSQISATIPAYTCRSKWNSEAGAQQISVEAVPAGSVIDWNNMLNNYTGSETATQKKAVADLMFYCGASVSMNYANGENGGSGAYSEDVPEALKTYFGYSDNTQLVSRDNYTNDSWDNLIYNELSNHRPVFYSGVTSSGGGHAFVCDGYDSDGYYHINWGWGGYCDTYFLLSDLTPQDQGTGGSSGGYNSSQQAMIGAEPAIDNTITLTPIFENGLQSFEVPALYYQPVIYAKDVNSKKEAYYYIDNKGKKLEGLGWRFDDGGNAPIATFPALQWDPATMSGYEYPGEPIEGTMLPLYRDFISKFAALKTAKIVPAVTATYQVSPASFSPNGYTIDFSTSTKIATGKIEMKNTGYENSMADNFASPIDRDGSKYNVEGGVLKVPFKLSDWGKYVEDLWYYFDRVDEETYKDSVNFISLQLTKEGEPTIISEKASVIHAFLLINGIVDNKPESKVLDCLTTDENWPSKRNDNAGTMYKYAEQAISAQFTHSIPYNKSLDILPFIETHVTYIGKKSKWTEHSQVMDATTFKSLGLRYEFSVVDYEDGNHATGESRHISIEPKANAAADFGYDEVILTPRSVAYDKNGTSFSTIMDKVATRETIGREPLIKVEIVDPSNNVLYVGYIKLVITDDDTQPVSHHSGILTSHYPIDDDYWMNSTSEGGLKWSQMEEFLSKLGENGYSKKQFEEEFEIDVLSDGKKAKRFIKSGDSFVQEEDPVGDVFYTKSTIDDPKDKQTNVINWAIGNDYQRIVEGITGKAGTAARDALLVNQGNGNETNALSTTVRFVKKNSDDPNRDAIYVTLSIAGSQVHFAYGEVARKDLSRWYQLNSYRHGSEADGTAIDIHESVFTPAETSLAMLETGTTGTPTFEFERPLFDNFLNSCISINSNRNRFSKYDYTNNKNVSFEFTLPVKGQNAEFGHVNGCWKVGGISGHVYTLTISSDHKAITDEHGCKIVEIIEKDGQPYIRMKDIDCANDILNYSGRYDQDGKNLANEAESDPFYLANSDGETNNRQTFTAYLKVVTSDPGYQLLLNNSNFNVKFLRPVNAWAKKSSFIAKSNEKYYIMPTDLLTAKDWRDYTLTLDRDLNGDSNYINGQIGWDFYNIYAISTKYDEIYTDHAAEKSVRDAVDAELSYGNKMSQIFAKFKATLNKVGEITSLNENYLKVTPIAQYDGVRVGSKQYKTAPQTRIEYTSNGNTQDFHLFVPIYIQYAWGHGPNSSLNHLRSGNPNTLKVWTIITVKAEGSGGGSVDPDTEQEVPDNTVYMDDMEVLSGTEAVLSVKMKNEVVAEGFEFDMYLPEGITVVEDEDGFPEVTLSTERTTVRKTNSFDAVFNADGSLRVLAASTNGSAISGNDGEVVQVKVALADDMIEGDYTVCFKNIAISDENAVSYNSPMTTSTIKVNTYTIGDANIDKKVDVADFTATAHHLLNRTPEKFHQKAADANTDNKIDVGDLTAIAHLILYGSVTKPTNTAGARPYMMMGGTPANENYIYIEPVSVQGQSEVTLSVKMKNAVEAEGFEFDLYLPDGMTFATDADGFAEVSLSTERTNSRKTNSFDAVIQQDGSLRVLAASTNGSSISGNDGEVALVTIHVDPDLNAGEYPLLLKNIAISDVNAVSHSTDLQESTITILGNGIVTGLDGVGVQSGTEQWYSLDGKKLNSKPKAKGVYIMNRQKVVIK